MKKQGPSDPCGRFTNCGGFLVNGLCAIGDVFLMKELNQKSV